MADVAVTADAVVNDNFLLAHTQVLSNSMAPNVSLVKLGTVAQTILGLVITGVVVSATVLTITLISVSVGVSAPVATDDFVSVYKTQVYPLYPLANDRDAKGSNLTIVAFTPPLHGIASLVNGKHIQYQSDMYYAGLDMVNYTISNGKLTASATIFITVLNNPPTTPDFLFEVSKNVENAAFDLFNVVQSQRRISDLDKDILVIDELSEAAFGTAVTNGSFVYYTPPPNTQLTDTFNYTVSDGNSTSTGSITIIVTNDPPVAIPYSLVVQKNLVQVINVLKDAWDPNSDNITLVGVGPCKAVVYANPDGTATYVPNPDTTPYSDSFEYTITDGELTATSYVTVTMLNTPPEAFNNTIIVNKNTPGGVALGMIDYDVLDSLEASFDPSVTLHGSLTLTQKTTVIQRYFADNWYDLQVNSFTVQYDPSNDYVGSDIIKFYVTDGFDRTAAFIEVSVLNQPPIANDLSFNCSKNNPAQYNLLSTNYDPNNDTIKLTDFTELPTEQGGKIVRINNDEVMYYPPQDYVGVDSVVYTITDIQLQSENDMTADAVVSFDVYNEAPVAEDDYVTVGRNLFATVDVLTNDTDANGDAIKVVTANSTSNAEAVINGGQTVTVYAGNDAAVEVLPYVISDPNDATAQASIHVKIINNPAVPADDFYSTLWRRNVMFSVVENDEDVNGDFITVYDFTNPSNGSIIQINSTHLIYNPDNGFVGVDSFTYRNFDEYDISTVSAKVTIDVTNIAPVATDFSVTTHWTEAIDIPVLTGSSDEDNDVVTIADFDAPSAGSVSFVTLPDGTQGLRYTPTNVIESIPFKYRVTDGYFYTEATVTVVVTNNIPAPTADELTIHWRANPATIYVLANDTDADGDTIKVSSISVPSSFKGNVTFTSANIVYDPTDLFLGTQTFTYNVSDGASDIAQTTVTIHQTNNHAPQPGSKTFTIHWTLQRIGSTFAVFGSSTPQDADNDPLSFSYSQASNGVVEPLSISDISFLKYTQTNGFLGTDTFTYTITDGIESADTQVTFNVYNNVPTCSNFGISRTWPNWYPNGISVNTITAANVTDLDAEDTPVLESVTPSGLINNVGNVTVDGNTIVFIPKKGFKGTQLLNLVFTDGLQTCSAIYNITVTNTAPVATPTPVSAHWRNALSGVPVPLYNDTVDAEADTITYNVMSISNGIAPQNQPGVLTFTQTSTSLVTSNIQVNYTDGWETRIATWSVTVYNSLPHVDNQTITIHWRNPQGIYLNFLVGSYDPDPADRVSLISTSEPASGATTSILETRLVAYNPLPSYVGKDSLYFDATDGLAVVRGYISIQLTNTLPTARNDVATMHWSQETVQIAVLNNDEDVNQDTISLHSVTVPATAVGTTTDSNGVITYTRGPANPSSIGSFTFYYTIYDGAQESLPANVTVTVTNNAVPVATNFTSHVHWRTFAAGMSYAFTSRRTDTDGDTYSATINTKPAALTVAQDNTADGITYKVSSSTWKKGIAEITYTLSDGIQSSPGKISLDVFNNPPKAANITMASAYATLRNGFYLNVLPQASDIDVEDSSSLTLQDSLDTSQLTLGATASVVTHLGTKQIFFKTTEETRGSQYFTYYISDGLDVTAGYVNITLDPSLLSAAYLFYTTHWRHDGVSFDLVDGMNLTGIDTSNYVLEEVTSLATSGGTVTITNATNVTYKQGAGFLGLDEFAVLYTNGGANNNTIFVTVSVTNNLPNVPLVESTIHRLQMPNYKVDLLSSASDNDGDSLTLTEIVKSSASGTATITDTNNVTYVPANVNFVGTETFLYKIYDGIQSRQNYFRLIVTNFPPITYRKNLSIKWRELLPEKNFTIDFMSGVHSLGDTGSQTDYDRDANDVIQIVSVNNPSSSAVTRTRNNGASISLSLVNPSAVRTGLSFTIRYTLTDGASNGQVQQDVAVTATNTAPVVVQDSYDIHWRETPYILNVLANDYDSDNDPIYITAASTSSGVVTFNDTHLTFTQNTNFQGTASISYTISDGAQTASGRAFVMISNTAPVAGSLSATSHWRLIPSTGYVINITNIPNDLVKDNDPLDTLTLVSITGSVNRMTVTAVSGTAVFKPSQGYVGTASYTYTVSDGLTSQPAAISFTVTNTAPVATSNVFFRPARNTTGILDLTPYITDANNDPIIVSSVTQGSYGGRITFNGLFINYTQTTNFVGTEKFTVTYSDGWSTAATRDYYVTVGGGGGGNIVTYALTASVHGYCFNIPIMNRTDGNRPTTSDTSATLVVANSFSGSYPASTNITTDGISITVCYGYNLNPFLMVYTVTDGTSVASNTIQVSPFNNAPNPQNFVINVHHTAASSVTVPNLLASAIDADGDVLTVTSVTTSSAGTLTRPNSTAMTFAPTVTSANQVFTINYVTTDGWVSVTRTVRITVQNNAPTGTNFAVSRRWNVTSFTIDMTSYMNDADNPDKPNLRITGSTPTAALAFSGASITDAGKSITISRTVVPSDIGATLSIVYYVYDGLTVSAARTISLSYTDAAPVATGYSETIGWKGTSTVSLGSRCSDSDDPVTLTAINGAPVANLQTTSQLQGTLTMVDSNTITVRYTPSPTMAYSTTSNPRSYTASYTFTCFDGLLSTVGTVQIIVRNNAPVAINKNYALARSASSTSYTITNFLAAVSPNADADADDTVSIESVQSAVLSGNNVIVTMDSSTQISKQFTYRLTDGQLLSNFGTVTVSLDSESPSCSSQTATVFKSGSASFQVDTICSNPSGVSMKFNQPSVSRGSVAITNNGATLTYTASPDTSGDVTFSFTVVDAVQKTTTSSITITVINRAPTAQAATWSILGVRNNNVHTLPAANYISLASATDPDSYDASRLKISALYPGSCSSSSTGTLSLNANKDAIVFNRLYTFDNSTCTFYVLLVDADKTTANALTVNSTVTMSLTTQGLIANGLTYSVVDSNGVFQLSPAQITTNDVDPLGGTFSFDTFVYLTCDQVGFCSRPEARPTQNGNLWRFTSKSLNCQIDRIMYRIISNQNPAIVAYGVLNIEYTSCKCLVPMDAVIVFDSSSSVGAPNFQLMQQFAVSLINNFVFADEGSDPDLNVRMGVVRFSDSNLLQPISPLTSSKSNVVNAITSMPYVGGSTWILDSIRLAEKMLSEQGRASVKNKVILVLFDGEPNGPCSCGECQSRYGSASITTPTYSTAVAQENQCKSSRYPFRTCNPCDLYYNWNLKCMPCSDIVPLCNSINSRKPDRFGVMENGYWRIIPVGIGQALSNAIAQQLLKDMSYDPTRSFYVQWDQLTALFDAVSSQTCNLVDISGPVSGPGISEMIEPASLQCGSIIGLRTASTYLRYIPVSNVATLSNDLQTDPNTAGKPRDGLWQIVCPGQSYGTNVTYASNIALWNLQTKTFLKRSPSNDAAAPTLTGTLSEVNSNTPQVLWNIASVGVTTTGKVYYDNTVCLGSTTTNKYLYVTFFSQNINPGTTANCVDSNQSLFPSVYRWRDLSNRSGISFTDFPTALPASEA